MCIASITLVKMPYLLFSIILHETPLEGFSMISDFLFMGSSPRCFHAQHSIPVYLSTVIAMAK